MPLAASPPHEAVPRQGGEELAEPVSFGTSSRAKTGPTLVGFVADHQVPAAVGRFELLLHLSLRESLSSRAIAGSFPETLPSGLLPLVVVRMRKAGESGGKLVLHCSARLPGSRSGTDQVAADDQIIDQKPAMIVLPARDSSPAGTGGVAAQNDW